MVFLEQIVNYKKEELGALRRRVSLKDVQLKAADAEAPRNFLVALEEDAVNPSTRPEGRSRDSLRVNIIAEIKKASPSAGLIRDPYKPADLAHILQEAGAPGLSVLTDEHFFKGSLNDLLQIKKAVKLPCLRKDFTLDEYHIYEARGAGADAILLVVAILDRSQLKDFYDLACELGMICLVEVHDRSELGRALQIHPRLIGVNNRDLKTLKTSLDISRSLAKEIPSHILRLSESGFDSAEQLQELKGLGFNGFLIGEALMRAEDPGAKLVSLRGA